MAEPKRSSIERIQRLEQLERWRLEEKERAEQRRQQVIAGARPSGGRHDLTDRVEQVMKWPMSVLGAAWLVIAVVAVTTGVSRSFSLPLAAALFVLWAIAVAEYLVRLVITPDTRGYLRRRWVEPATVVVPALQGGHFVGIEKLSLLAREAQLRTGAVLRHHSLFRVLLAAAATLLTGAWLVLLLEQHASGSNIRSYPQALWWAVVTVTTVGYGDSYPVTEGARIVALVLMLLGISLIGVLTATIASVFVKEHTDSAKDEQRRHHADLGQQLAEISQRLAAIERRLDAAPARQTGRDTALRSIYFLT